MHESWNDDVQTQSSEGARELLLRLYREIGISAVAAALEVARLPDPEDAHAKQTAKDVPAILRGHDRAA